MSKRFLKDFFLKTDFPMATICSLMVSAPYTLAKTEHTKKDKGICGGGKNNCCAEYGGDSMQGCEK